MNVDATTPQIDCRQRFPFFCNINRDSVGDLQIHDLGHFPDQL